MKNINKYIFFIITILYFELLFITLTNIDISYLLLKILFSVKTSLLICILQSFKRKTNQIISGILITIISITFVSQYIYYTIFENLLSLNIILGGIQITQFGSQIHTVLIENWYAILLFILPIIIYFYFKDKIVQEKINKKETIVIIGVFLIVSMTTTLILKFDNTKDIYSAKNLYYNIHNQSENLKKFGLLTAVRLDLQRTIFPFKEKQLYKYEDIDGNVTIINKDDYNMVDISFDLLIENETNEEIKEIHQYFKYQKPTKKNEYTGMFEGKNLIVIMAESFSSLAINKEITPTLYMVLNQGFRFNNFYTPLFPVSTADGQYLSDMSLIPSENEVSMKKLAENQVPYAYGNLFKNLGYKTYAYHNYKYDYYQRDSYFKTLGYDSYLAFGNGLEERMDFSKTPSSDYEMIKSTINDYVKEDKFLAYYVTMSGHMNYDKTNDMVVKNWSKVEHLPYSDKAKAYLATQIELDKAIEEIIKTLERNNKLKDTVIIISGDHYPYGLNEKEIRELSPYDMNNYEIERFHMPFVIYNGENQEVIEVNKYGSSLDILPTILNLFGIKYDSRLLMGKDILSNDESLVIFSNRSFITKEGIYNSNTNSFISNNHSMKDYSEYINKIQKEIYLKYRYSRLILKNDYYKYIIK